MASLLRVKILNSETTLYEGDCSIAVMHAPAGELGIMAGHTRYVTPLKKGRVDIKDETHTVIKSIEIESGILYVEKDGAKIIL